MHTAQLCRTRGTDGRVCVSVCLSVRAQTAPVTAPFWRLSCRVCQRARVTRVNSFCAFSCYCCARCCPAFVTAGRLTRAGSLGSAQAPVWTRERECAHTSSSVGQAVLTPPRPHGGDAGPYPPSPLAAGQEASGRLCPLKDVSVPQAFQDSQGSRGLRETRDGPERLASKETLAGRGTQAYQVRRAPFPDTMLAERCFLPRRLSTNLLGDLRVTLSQHPGSAGVGLAARVPMEPGPVLPLKGLGAPRPGLDSPAQGTHPWPLTCPVQGAHPDPPFTAPITRGAVAWVPRPALERLISEIRGDRCSARPRLPSTAFTHSDPCVGKKHRSTAQPPPWQ